MLIRTEPKLREADITDPALHASCRTVLAGMGLGMAALLGGAGPARRSAEDPFAAPSTARCVAGLGLAERLCAVPPGP